MTQSFWPRNETETDSGEAAHAPAQLREPATPPSMSSHPPKLQTLSQPHRSWGRGQGRRDSAGLGPPNALGEQRAGCGERGPGRRAEPRGRGYLRHPLARRHLGTESGAPGDEPDSGAACGLGAPRPWAAPPRAPPALRSARRGRGATEDGGAPGPRWAPEPGSSRAFSSGARRAWERAASRGAGHPAASTRGARGRGPPIRGLRQACRPRPRRGLQPRLQPPLLRTRAPRVNTRCSPCTRGSGTGRLGSTPSDRRPEPLQRIPGVHPGPPRPRPGQTINALWPRVPTLQMAGRHRRRCPPPGPSPGSTGSFVLSGTGWGRQRRLPHVTAGYRAPRGAPSDPFSSFRGLVGLSVLY